MPKLSHSKLKAGCSPKTAFGSLALLLALTQLSACSSSKEELAVEKVSKSELQASSFLPLNADKPGTPVNAEKYLVPGKYTIVVFFSPYDPACATLGPQLMQLARVKPDIAVRTININRPGIEGVDWQSPVLQSAQIQAVPHFQIYDTSQNLRAHGRPAYEQVVQWLKTMPN
ncbi:MAG: hypothetical protein K2X27_21110 [Candidatus Obscuribacterales bacterium]|nr:hypothetical protein [Candidatus Obscuribacterales bacterium]